MKDHPFFFSLSTVKSICLLIIATLALSAYTLSHGDPYARLGTSMGGEISVEDFQEIEGVNATYDDHGVTKEATVKQFTLTWVEKGKDPVEVINRKSTYNEKAQKLIDQAKPGTVYYYDNVTVKYPGNPEDMKINSMVFKIK